MNINIHHTPIVCRNTSRGTQPKPAFFIRAILMICLGLLLINNPVFSQSGSAVTVTVTDVAGKPLRGVSISSKEKFLGTSNTEGKITLKNIAANTTLTVVHVGYTTIELKVKEGETTLAVKLQQSVNTLNEVVVNTGLYKRSGTSFTGDAHTMTGEDLKMVNPVSVIKGLTVLDPSLRIIENNVMGSDPNTLPVIQLRGQNNLPLIAGSNGLASSVSQGDIMSSYASNPNQPLIIIDGFQSTLQALYDMDINRIERITVLKDAAATVAYGSKAANGVLVVETKLPVAGKLQVTYAVNLSTSVPDLSSYHLLDANGLLQAQQYAGIYNDKSNNNVNDIALKQWYDERLYQVQRGVNTDWLAKPVHTGFGMNHSVSVSGGNNAVRFALSLSYTNSTGAMKGSNRNTYAISNVISYNSAKFRISNNTGITYNKANNSLWGSYGSYASAFPYFSPTDSLGNIAKVLEPSNTALGIPITAPGNASGFPNPMYNSTLNGSDYSYYLSFVSGVNMDWILRRDLHLTGGVNFSSQLPGAQQFLTADNTSFLGSLATFTDLGSYKQTTGKNAAVDVKLNLDYNKKIGRHTFYLALGTTAQTTNSSSTTVTTTGLPMDELGHLGMANGYNYNNAKPVVGFNNTRSLSMYSSLSYNYLERYVLEGTINASGSSQFGSNNKFAPFYAYGAAWNIDKESFFRKNNIVQRLRLKATYGITGNQNFSSALATPTYQYNTANNYRLQLGSTLMAYPNADLKWQQTGKLDFSVLATLFNNRINIAASYYIENTDNLILPIGVEPSTGFATYQDNLGATQNKGYEVNISAVLVQNKQKNLTWTMAVNAGHYKNILKSLSPAIQALNDQNDDSKFAVQTSPLPRYVVGQSMSRIWAVKSLGIDPATGNEIFQKRDGTTTFAWSAADKQPLGETSDKIKGAVSTNVTYKGFLLNIALSFAYGGQQYNQTLVDKVENVDVRITNADSRVLTERWKQPGDNAQFKSLALNGIATNATSRFIQDNNYINAASISVGYSFPQNAGWVRKMHISAPRLYITQNDVFRFATIKMERGTSYPFARNFSIGLSTSF